MFNPSDIFGQTIAQLSKGWADTTKGFPCNCMGPRPGDPVCPCMMSAHREREAGKKALELLRANGKPRFRVKAGRSVTV